eukprot:2122117-Rhodomonas_salina.1
MGKKVADQQVGTTPEKVQGDSRERMSNLLETDAEGASLLIAEPIHPHFWRFPDPYVAPCDRAAQPFDPMTQALLWREALWEVSPELLMLEEWALVPVSKSDFQKAKGVHSWFRKQTTP